MALQLRIDETEPIQVFSGGKRVFRAGGVQLRLTQTFLDEFFRSFVLPVLVVRESGCIRLKAPARMAREMGVPEKGAFMAWIRGYIIAGRYDTSGYFLRFRIPRAYQCLFYEDERRILVSITLGEQALYLGYKPDEKTPLIPACKTPDYRRGIYWCSRCGIALPLMDVCPECGTKTRKKPRKRKTEIASFTML